MKRFITLLLVASFLQLSPLPPTRSQANSLAIFVISLAVIGGGLVIYLTWKYPEEGQTRWFVLQYKESPFGPGKPWVNVQTNALRIVPNQPFPAFYQLAYDHRTNYIFRVVEIERPENWLGPQFGPGNSWQPVIY